MVNYPITLYRGKSIIPIIINAADTAGLPYNLTGWFVYSVVRKSVQGSILLDLNPVITNAANGEITIDVDVPFGLPEGEALWDLVLKTPTAKILPPFIGGVVTITTAMTQP